MVAMVAITVMTVVALAAGIGAGFLLLEGMLSALRTAAFAVEEPTNVIEFRPRATGQLERAA
jgi:hypothetical protein